MRCLEKLEKLIFGVLRSLRMEGSNLSENLEAPNIPHSIFLVFLGLRIFKKGSILKYLYYVLSNKLLLQLGFGSASCNASNWRASFSGSFGSV